jgi:hypothetical protein
MGRAEEVAAADVEPGVNVFGDGVKMRAAVKVLRASVNVAGEGVKARPLEAV